MTGQGEAKPAISARQVARAASKAALGTILGAADGWSCVSRVAVATDHEGAPLLLSDLSKHARNLKGHSRAPLLFDAIGEREVPLAGEPVTLGLAKGPATPLAAQPDVARASGRCGHTVLRRALREHPRLRGVVLW